MTAAATLALVAVAVWLATEITQSRRHRPLDMDAELHRIERGIESMETWATDTRSHYEGEGWQRQDDKDVCPGCVEVGEGEN